MIVLVVKALGFLLFTGRLMRGRGIRELHQAVKNEPVRRPRTLQWSAGDLCRSIDIACVIYLKSVLCLQRSAATTILLRRYGFHAQLVIGARVTPFKSHAWVEIDQRVVNDKPYTQELYLELERC